jgi:hypothetical protein
VAERVKAVFADAPILFFAVVIGVALTFRVAVGAVRDAAQPEPVAPTFATTSPIVTGPEPGLASGTASVTGSASTSTAEVGAAAKVQPIGFAGAQPSTPSAPAPARVAPKPRGHGRRPIRGGDRRPATE